jgi:membrane associated rhomboid family serine protease/cytochrome c-type biogenesis protein CcmH/NrfG
MANCVQCGRKLSGFTFGRKLCPWCVQHEAAKRGENSGDAVQRVEAPPWLRAESTSMMVTQAIFGINVAVFLGMLFAGVSIIDNPSGQDLVRWGANSGPYTLSGQWWRLLTCVFVHGSLLHIAFNMWCLWDLGSLAESLYGHATFGVIYLITGVLASVASILWNPHVLSVGASGAIFGIAGALIAAFYLGEFSFPRAGISGVLRSLVFFVGFNLIYGAMSSYVDNAAHVGGLISGLILGAAIAKLAPGRDSPLRRFAALALVFAILGGGTAWWLYSRDYLRHMQRGIGYLGEGKTDQSIAELQTVIRRRPDFVPGHFALAGAYATKGDLANAEAEYRRVIQLNPRSEGAFNNLGFVLLEEKKLAEARQTFQQLLALNSSYANARFGLGSVAFAEGNYQQAIEEFKQASLLDPDMEGVYYRMGQAQAQLKQYDEAIDSYLKEQKRIGDDYDLEVALAAAYEAQGRKQDAADARQKAAQLTGQE